MFLDSHSSVTDQTTTLIMPSVVEINSNTYQHLEELLARPSMGDGGGFIGGNGDDNGGKGRGGGDGGDGEEGDDDKWRRIRDWMRRGQQAEVIAYCLGVLGLYLVAALVALHTWYNHLQQPHLRRRTQDRASAVAALMSMRYTPALLFQKRSVA